MTANPWVSVMGRGGGRFGSVVRKFYWAEKFSYRTTNAPPIILTHCFRPLQPSTPFILSLQLGPLASPPPTPHLTPSPSRTYYKSTAICKVHKGPLRFIKFAMRSLQYIPLLCRRLYLTGADVSIGTPLIEALGPGHAKPRLSW